MTHTDNDILQLTRCGIDDAGGLDTERPVGVALSGGADSVALLALLTDLGYRCVALHCNFHLRGQESDRDERHAAAIAARLGAEIEIADMDVAARRRETGESVEMACRELRYSWFSQRAAALGLQAVAVAHHRDDQIETFFLNLLRGSGVRGLAAMRPRNGLIIRPLLGITRQEIERYLTQRGLDYIIDSTNLSDDFKRNRLRNRVIPLLNELFPGASDSIAHSIAILRSQAKILDQAANRYKRLYMSEDGVIDLRRLISTEPHPADTLYELLAPQGFNRSTTDDIIRSSRRSGRRFNGKTSQYLLERGILRPVGNDTARKETATLAGTNVTTEVLDRGDVESLRCPPDTILLDARALDGNPVWQWRRWREGDRIAPFGMKGTRLLSDLFSDLHLPLERRKSQPILTRNGLIIWLPGIRASRHFTVTQQTDKILKIHFDTTALR